MNSKKTEKYFKLASLGFLLVFFLSTPVCSCIKEIDFAKFHVIITDVRLETMTADVRIEANIEGNLGNQSDIFVRIYNIHYDKELKKIGYREETTLTLNKSTEWLSKKGIRFKFNATKERRFRIFGWKQAYPYDNYLLNFTIEVFTRTPIRKENTSISVTTYPTQWHGYIPEYEITSKEIIQEIKAPIVILRAERVVGFETLFFVLTAIVGSAYLIESSGEKNALYIAVFLTTIEVVSIYSQGAPPKAGNTIAHVLIKFLLFSTGAYAINDIWQLYLKKAEEVNPIFEILFSALNNVLPTTISVFFCLAWRQTFNFYAKAWWINLPPYINPWILFFFSGTYLGKNYNQIRRGTKILFLTFHEKIQTYSKKRKQQN